IGLAYIGHFNKHTIGRTEGVYRPLIFYQLALLGYIYDGYSAHLTHEFIKFCDVKKIIPPNLPSHTSHIMWLLNVVVF
ncbi:hypothetical protein K469DRAFT_559975, partial [Zopfia rhizophila CBS 207.26]